MAEKTAFIQETWKRLRPEALAAAVDTGHYLIIWASILAEHTVKYIVAATGVDPDVIRMVSFLEKWVWIGTFVMFFLRLVMRLVKAK
jgi:hypothetical protein